MCKKYTSAYCYPRYLYYLSAMKNPTTKRLHFACEDINCLRNITEVIILTRITEAKKNQININLETETYLKALHGVDMTCLKVDNVFCYPIVFQMKASTGPVCSCWTAFHEATKKMFPYSRETAIQKNAKDFFCTVDSHGKYCGQKTNDLFITNVCPDLNGSNPVCTPECQNKFIDIASKSDCCLNSFAKFSDKHIGFHYKTKMGYVQDWINNTCKVKIPSKQCNSLNIKNTNDSVAPFSDISAACYKITVDLMSRVLESPTQAATSLLCNSPCFSPGSKHRAAHEWVCTKIEGEYCYPKFMLLNDQSTSALNYACGNKQCLKEMTEVLFMLRNGENMNITEKQLQNDLDDEINGINLRCVKVNNKYCSLDIDSMDDQEKCSCFQKFNTITKKNFPKNDEVEIEHSSSDLFCTVDPNDGVSCGKKTEKFIKSHACPVLNGSNPVCTNLCRQYLEDLSSSCCLRELVEFGESHANSHYGTRIGYVKQWIEASCDVDIPSSCHTRTVDSTNLEIQPVIEPVMKPVMKAIDCYEMNNTKIVKNGIINRSCTHVKVHEGQVWIFDFIADDFANQQDIIILIWPSKDCSIFPDSGALLYTRGSRHRQIFRVPSDISVMSVVVYPYHSTSSWSASLCLDASMSVKPLSVRNREHGCSSYCSNGIQSVTYRYEGEDFKDLIVKPANIISVIPGFELKQQMYAKRNESVMVAKNISHGFTFTMHPTGEKMSENCALEFFITPDDPHIVDICCQAPSQLRPGNIYGHFQIIETINGDGMKMCETKNATRKQHEPTNFYMNNYSILAYSQSSHSTQSFEPIYKKNPDVFWGISLNQNISYDFYSNLPIEIFSWIYGS